MRILLEKEQDYVIFHISGDFIISEIPKLKKEIEEAIEKEKIKKIIFDMSDVDFIDSAGLGLVANTYKTIKKLNGKFAVYGLKKKVAEIFKFAQLIKFINVYDNLDDAKKDFL